MGRTRSAQSCIPVNRARSRPRSRALNVADPSRLQAAANRAPRTTEGEGVQELQESGVAEWKGSFPVNRARSRSRVLNVSSPIEPWRPVFEKDEDDWAECDLSRAQ
jgi:hypothetical protein